MNSNCLAALTAGGACAVVVLLAFAPHHEVQHWTAAGTSVSRVQSLSVPKLRAVAVPPLGSSQVLAAPLGASTQNFSQPTHFASQVWVPVALVASGMLALVAAVVKLLKPSATSLEYSSLALAAETQQYRLARELKEKERADRVKQEIQERLLRLASMGASVPQTASATPISAPGVSTVSDWEQRQQMREQQERERAAAKQREIQERLERLSKLGASTPVQAAPISTSAAPVSTEWEKRQQMRERQEKEKAEAKQREIQERLARLAQLGSPQQIQAPAAPTATASVADWERRQQQRQQREAEIAEAKKQEIQARLARLAQLGSSTPQPAAPVSSPAAVNDWARRQEERERQERAKAEAAKREIQERMARLARLSAGSQ